MLAFVIVKSKPCRMGKKFITVVCRARVHNLYQVDLRVIRCFKKPELPPLPRYESPNEAKHKHEMVLEKEADEESACTLQS